MKQDKEGRKKEKVDTDWKRRRMEEDPREEVEKEEGGG